MQTKRTTYWFAFPTIEEARKWYSCIEQAWREEHSHFTESLTTPSFLRSSTSRSLSSDSVSVGACDEPKGAELDPELSLIMCKLDESNNQSDIKNYLMEIEMYQNQHPIEQLVTQKAL